MELKNADRTDNLFTLQTCYEFVQSLSTCVKYSDGKKYFSFGTGTRKGRCLCDKNTAFEETCIDPKDLALTGVKEFERFKSESQENKESRNLHSHSY